MRGVTNTIGNKRTHEAALREFRNLMSVPKIQKRLDGALMCDLKYREQVFAAFYGLPVAFVERLIQAEAEERLALVKEHHINGYIYRTFFEYNRYGDCYRVLDALENPEDLKGARVLDFGCAVADYGFFFGMLGAEVTICDFEEFVAFADFRLTRADIVHRTVKAPVDYDLLTQEQDFVVFGEVLEHLKDPYNLLERCVDNEVPMIYTSCYPFGDDAYFNLTGHTKEAKDQAERSLGLLRERYEEQPLCQLSRLWVKK